MSAFVLPALKFGGALLGTGFLGKKMGQPSTKAPAPLPYQAETAGAAKTLGTRGGQLSQFAQPMLERSGKYFGSLLGGNRAAMTQAVQPEATSIRDLYRGASRSIESGNLRGASREMARADVSRESAGRVAGLIPSIRPMAAREVGELGRFGTQAGAGMTQASGGLYADLLGGQERRKQYEDMLRQQAGGQAGGLFMNLLKMFPDFFFGKGGGGMKGLVSGTSGAEGYE